MTIIFIIIAILFLVLIGWMWNSLGNINKLTKINYIVVGLVVIYTITFIIYNISKIGINYDSKETMKVIRAIYVVLFTIVNGYIILPYTFRKLEKVNNEEIEKEKLKKSIVIIGIIIMVLAILEILYFGSLQQGILKMINK